MKGKTLIVEWCMINKKKEKQTEIAMYGRETGHYRIQESEWINKQKKSTSNCQQLIIFF